MKSAAISMNVSFPLRHIMLAAVALSCLFSFAPQARAAQLTQAQIQAVTNLLNSFGTDQATIQKISQDLASGSVASSAGTLTISTDPASPNNQIAAGGATGVFLTSFSAMAQGEDMSVNQATLNLDDYDFSPGDIGSISLWSGSQLLGTGVVTPSDARPQGYAPVIIFATPLVIAKDSSKTIMVKVDVAPIGTGKPGTPGHHIQACSMSLRATGLSSDSTITGPGPGLCSLSEVYFYKSYPTVSLVPLSSTQLTAGTIGFLRFQVTASSAGPVDIKQFTVFIAGNNISLPTASLYAFTGPTFSNPVSGQGQGGFIASASTVNKTSVALVAATPIEIPAGQTYYFEVRGNVNFLTAGPAAIFSTLMGDSSASSLGQVSDLNSFIWSPNSTTVSTFAQADWTNGYAVPGLPSSGLSQTLSGTGTGANTNNGTPPVVTPTAPTCSLSTSPASLKNSDKLTLSWATTGGTASWQQSGVSTLLGLKTSALVASGTQTIVLKNFPAGGYTVTLGVSGPSGSGNCSGQFSVMDANAAKVSGVFNASTLKATTAIPTITGTASANALYLNLSINGSVISFVPQKGVWSYTVPSALASGNYPVVLMDQNNNTLATGVLAVALPQPPACAIGSDKAFYALGDSVKLKWSSTGAKTAQWLPDTSGKDTVAVPSANPALSGTAAVKATVLGNPSVTLQVSGLGGTATCTATFAVRTKTAQAADGAATLAVRFATDYSDAFNTNLAAVVFAPFNFYVPILSNYFSALGI